MAEKVKVGDAYVNVGLKDETEADATKIRRDIKRRLPGKAYIPVGAKLDESSGPAMDKLRNQLYDLRRSAKITATYESRQVVDELGRYHTRYFKVSQQSGTFIGEVMSKHAMKSLATMMRMPGLFGPAAAGFAGGFGAALQVYAPLEITKRLGAALVGSESWDKFKKLGQDAAKNPAVAEAAGEMVQGFYRHVKIAAEDAGIDKAYIQVFNRATDFLKQNTDRTSQVFSTGMAQMMDRGSQAAMRAVDRAFPGIIMSMQRSYAVIDGLSDGLEESAFGFTAFMDEATKSSIAAGQVFRTFGVIARDAGGDVGKVSSAFVDLFGSQLWDEAEAVFGSLFNIIGNFVSNALGPFGVGMEIASNILAKALAIVEPFAGILGTWVGTVLGATVVVRGFSSAMGVLAATTALMRFDPLSSSLKTLTTQVGTSGAGLSTWATKATGSTAVGEKLASTTSRVVDSMKKVGDSVPIIGTVLVAAALGYEEFGSKAEENARKAANGSITLQEAINNEIAQLEKNQLWWNSASQQKQAHAAVTQDVIARFNAERAALGALGQVQLDVTLRQREYDMAVRDHTANSPQARDAAQALAAARREEERATFAAKLATRDHTQALIDNQNQILSLANADFAHRQALYEQTRARKDLAAAVREHGASSDQAKDAQFRLEGAELRVIESSGRLAAENRGLATDGDKARFSADAQREAILRAASAADGSASPAMLRLAASMDNTAIDANNAAVRTSGLAFEVRSLPDGRKVLISTPGLQEARDGIRGLQTEIRNINGKDVSIFVTATGKGGVASAGRLATGGPVRGPGSGTSDTAGLFALSNGEHVWTAKEVRAAGGHSAMNIMRKEVIRQGRGFAEGGATDLRLNTRYKYNGPSPNSIFGGLAERHFASMGPGPGSGTNKWVGVVLRALSILGQPSSLLGTTLRRMNQESGGNARAINLWDINAKRGIPSKGLMQVIDPTFRAYAMPGYNRDIYDPLSNVLASMRYALGRYGSLSAAYNRKGGYDEGGLASGVGFLPKATPSPERVLSPQQTEAFERWMDAGAKSGGSAAPVQNVTIYMQQPPGSPAEAARYVALALRGG